MRKPKQVAIRVLRKSDSFVPRQMWKPQGEKKWEYICSYWRQEAKGQALPLYRHDFH